MQTLQSSTNFIIDEETIRKIGLRLTDKKISPPSNPNARIFEYPHMENVFVMESDLYGNSMPPDFCFIVFYGKHGFIGTEVDLETLKNASPEDIRQLVQRNVHG
ncbi:hypothetical protein V9K67_14230 [Paraflavisolibacter sp. H34]|uniref:hypothetical protein n=1 Tax=Huijunlia imazamoxiresistens TaxID=3127457 RepID=UPI003017B297